MKNQNNIKKLSITLLLLAMLVLVPAASVSANPGPVLVARWNLDEGIGASTVADSSGNGNTGTVVGATTGEAGKFGNALSFDGKDDYVECGSGPSITGGLTIEAWIFLEGYGSYYPYYPSYVSKGDVGNYMESYALFHSPAGQLAFLLNSNGTPGGRTIVWGSAYGIPLKTWTHVAGTYDGVTMRIYINGSPDGSGAHSGGIYATPVPDSLKIGQSYRLTYPGGSTSVNGVIDEVRIWSSALTATQLDDMTPPEITINVPADGVEYLLNQVVLANWSAEDEAGGSGLKSATGTKDPGVAIDTATVGEKAFTVTATDNAGNSDTKTITYFVNYGFIGLLPPYQAPPKAFKITSSIPLKWQYTDYSGTVIDSSAANPSIEIKPWVLSDTLSSYGDPITPNDPGSSGLRYDSETMTWQFNWQTKGLTAGIYGIWVTSGQTGQTDGPFEIQLRK